MEDNIKEKYKIQLSKFGDEDSLRNVIAGGHYFEKIGGTPINEYWQTDKFDLRDEFYLVLNTYFGISTLPKNIKHNNSWREAFDVAFLFPIFAIVESSLSLELLTKNKCYIDCFAVLRAMLSRVNVLLLCSLKPSLFNEWMGNPKAEKFLDGHIRRELENNGVFTASHLYGFTSEILHGQVKSLFDIGYLYEPGFLNEVKPIRNQIFVIAKYILAIITYSMVQIAILDFGSKAVPKYLSDLDSLFEKYIDTILVPNRFEHIWTMHAEERHWEKVGKDKYIVGGLYDFKKYKEILGKFHMEKGQKKTLSKKY
ncbi:MAG: hypothetical protein JEZ03_07080 [Bacteroidales bacterium]|nr:hypothetical protein [Bacteroidales bacterium]